MIRTEKMKKISVAKRIEKRTHQKNEDVLFP